MTRHILGIVLLLTIPVRAAGPRINPLFQTVDLNAGQSTDIKLSNGKTVAVKLIGLKEHRCEIRSAVRRAVVTVELDSRRTELVCAT